MNKTLWAATSIVLLGGCAGQQSADAISHETRSTRIVADLDSSIFERVVDTALQRKAVRGPGKGGVQWAIVYQVKPGKSANVYRVFDGVNAWRYGGWWSLVRPSQDSAAYRSTYEICHEWNTFDSLETCRLLSGARFAIGPGESADCKMPPSYGRSDSFQVYLGNAAASLDTAHCSVEPKSWETRSD